MKTVTYTRIDGTKLSVEYDEMAPCDLCGESVLFASTAGTTICPWCDMGRCRYCGVDMAVVGEHVDGGRSLRRWRAHMAWHRHPAAAERKEQNE